VRLAPLGSIAVELEVRYGRFLGDWPAALGGMRSRDRRAQVSWTAAVRIAALAATAALAVMVGTVVGGSRAAASVSAGDPLMPVCNPGEDCTPTQTTTTAATTPTTSPGATVPTGTNPSGGGGIPQCSDARDNDGDGLADMTDPGCAGDWDNDESNDPPVSMFVGTGGTQFARLDEGVVGVDAVGAAVRCARVGAERYERGIASKGWSFYMTLRWCWNGRVVTSWSNWDKWVVNHIPFPFSIVYPLDWQISSVTPPSTGLAQTSAFAQAKVQVCPIKLPVCYRWFPWLRFNVDGQGHALCESDVSRSIPDCKA